jgi:hypothetical protein
MCVPPDDFLADLPKGSVTLGGGALPVHWADEIHLTNMGDINGTAVIAMRFDGKRVCVQLHRDGVGVFRDQLTKWLDYGWAP